MARSLLRSEQTTIVSAYDHNTELLNAFHTEAIAANKAKSTTTRSSNPATSLSDAVIGVDVVVLVLVNESQCNSVCFGDDGLIQILGDDDDADSSSSQQEQQQQKCVILCSTVSATFARKANAAFRAKSIYFVDCPISGGPVRALSGELTMMSSGDEESLNFAMPLLQAMGTDLHLCGEAGMGSTVKMVHQLLAGVHICCAAEALSLAAKAGVDVELMYNIVNGAAGASWMFRDRGQRMIAAGDPDVKSALQIFVKDLDIVYAEAKALQSPIPVASAALQQFISGVGLGLGRKDDSQVVKVYEAVTKAPVGTKGSAPAMKEQKEGDEVGEFWKLEDGTLEEILEVADEPCHFVALANEYTRVLKVKFVPGYTTLAHRHAEDSLYYFLVEDGTFLYIICLLLATFLPMHRRPPCWRMCSFDVPFALYNRFALLTMFFCRWTLELHAGLKVVNHVKGSAPQCDCMDFGEVRFGNHKEDKPLVHKITNMCDKDMFCIDAEVIKRPPIISAIPLVAEYHELIKTREKCRVYHFTLGPRQSTIVTYAFFYLNIVLRGSTIKTGLGGSADGSGGISWEEETKMGDTHWKEPCVNMRIENLGSTVYEAFISEWR